MKDTAESAGPAGMRERLPAQRRPQTGRKKLVCPAPSPNTRKKPRLIRQQTPGFPSVMIGLWLRETAKQLERLGKQMCKKMTVAYADLIGKRLVGWCLFNGKDYSFLSERQVKDRLQNGDAVNGLKLDENGAVVIDENFTRALMGKSGLTFGPVLTAGDEADEPVVNKYYALVKVVKDKSGNRYHFVTNRCGYEVFDGTQVKAMLEVLSMGGVRLNKGKVEVHKAVDVDDQAEATKDGAG